MSSNWNKHKYAGLFTHPKQQNVLTCSSFLSSTCLVKTEIYHLMWLFLKPKLKSLTLLCYKKQWRAFQETGSCFVFDPLLIWKAFFRLKVSLIARLVKVYRLSVRKTKRKRRFQCLWSEPFLGWLKLWCLEQYWLVL